MISFTLSENFNRTCRDWWVSRCKAIVIAHLRSQNCTGKPRLQCQSNCNWFSYLSNLSEWLVTMKTNCFPPLQDCKCSCRVCWLSWCQVIMIAHLLAHNCIVKPNVKFHCNWKSNSYFLNLSKWLVRIQTFCLPFVINLKAHVWLVGTVSAK